LCACSCHGTLQFLLFSFLDCQRIRLGVMCHLDPYRGIRARLLAPPRRAGREIHPRNPDSVGEEALRNPLLHACPFYIRLRGEAGDILVRQGDAEGRVASPPAFAASCRAIFGEKAADVRDTSMRLTAGRSPAKLFYVSCLLACGGVDKMSVRWRIERAEMRLACEGPRRERASWKRSFAARAG